jgi:hypothetical protein
MSGGKFDYVQFRFAEVVETIRSAVDNNESNEDNGWGGTVGQHLPPDIIEKFTEAADLIERAQKMATRIDWLLSGDDGEDSFRRRWKEEGLDDLPIPARFVSERIT